MEESKMSEDENEPMEINDSNSNDSEDSSDTDGEEQNQTRRGMELEEQISNNKYLYDAHIELIDVYRKLGDLKSLRAAYQRFHEIFPLTPKLWLTWIRGEIKLATTAAEKENIFTLFSKAIEDYLSVELWVEYAQYAIGAKDLQTTREILEKGLTSAGLHVTQGCLLWDTLRELEFAHLSIAPEESDQRKQQLARVTDVFKRQLSVPLMDMENTYHEWQGFLKTLPSIEDINTTAIDWGYNNALKTLESYKPYEEKLLTVEEENDIYEVYKEYIEAVSDPSTKMCLYERAATTLCLHPALWLDYCLYTFGLGEVAMSVSKRALRNVPWSEDLWAVHIRILENLQKCYEEVKEAFEQGIQSVSPPALDLWLTYIEYVVRNCNDDDKVDKLFVQASQQLGHEGDPTSKVNRLHARILARRGDMTAARKIWNGLINRSNNKGSANVWLEYANLERQYGQPQQLRTIYQKALSSCKEWASYIAEEWLMYERETGTLSDVVKCLQKCKGYISYQPVAIPVETVDVASQHKGKKRRHEEENQKETRKKLSRQEEKWERPNSAPKPIIRKNISKDPEKTVFVSNLHPKVTEEKLREFFPNAEEIELVLDRKGQSKCFAYVQFKMEEQVMVALARDREPLDGRPVFISPCKPDRNERKTGFKYADTVEKNKLFVRGLPIKKSQAEIEDIFKEHGATEVRLVTHKSGQPKGLAYVQFPDAETAIKALKATDQMEIDGHKVTVAISAPPPKKSFDISSSKQPLREPVRHARSKLGVTFIPRQIQVKKSESTSSGTEVSTVSKNGSSASEKPKSNDDFRKMLLNK